MTQQVAVNPKSETNMRCPKCHSLILVWNEDGDYECLCGYVIYQHKEEKVIADAKVVILPTIKHPAIPVKQETEPTKITEVKTQDKREARSTTLARDAVSSKVGRGRYTRRVGARTIRIQQATPKVLALKEQGVSNHQISYRTGLALNTVKRILRIHGKLNIISQSKSAIVNTPIFVAPKIADNNTHLTNTELAILGLIAEGLANNQIASMRNVTVQTIKNTIICIYKKLGVHKRTQALLVAQSMGLIKVRDRTDDKTETGIEQEMASDIHITITPKPPKPKTEISKKMGRPPKYTASDLVAVQHLHDTYHWGCLRISRKLGIPRTSVSHLLKASHKAKETQSTKQELQATPETADVRTLLHNLMQADLRLFLGAYMWGVEERKASWDTTKDLHLDAYAEAQVEFNDYERMAALVMEWIQVLLKSEDNAFLRGVHFTLSNLCNYFTSLDNMRKEAEAQDAGIPAKPKRTPPSLPPETKKEKIPEKEPVEVGAK